MKRTLFVIAAASLLACVLAAGGWWRSMDFTDYVLWDGGFKAEATNVGRQCLMAADEIRFNWNREGIAGSGRIEDVFRWR